MRFIVQDNILSIQIQDGFLESDGTINESTLFWQKVTYDSDNSREIVSYKINEKNNIIHLDDLEVKPGNFLTGLKFLVWKDEGKNVLKLAIQETEFDKKEGKLTGNVSPWKINYVPTSNR